MKLKIKVKVLTEGCMPQIIEQGEWIDLVCAENTTLHASQSGTLRKVTKGDTVTHYRDVTTDVQYIPLGVAMKLPNGFEAIVAPRSSTPKKFGIFVSNSIGIIDNSYSSNEDEWKLVTSPLKFTKINKGDRICQFRIQLSQKATFWQKLKWLFSSGVELVEVEDLGNNSRGGFGSTGIN